MTFPPRPHNNTCVCAECQDWARLIVATPTERKPMRQPEERRDELPLAEFMAKIIAVACKATGLTEEQLRERAKSMGEDIPEPKPIEYSRDAVAARGVPETHLESVYDREPIECDALKCVREAMTGHRHLLVLSGGVGVRKSGSACWSLVKRPGRYVKASRLSALASSPLDDERALYSMLFRCQTLVIDDLGGEYVDDKGFFAKIIAELVDERYERKLVTIITTNLDAAEFKAKYGERIADRIRERGRFVDIKGASVRKAS